MNLCWLPQEAHWGEFLDAAKKLSVEERGPRLLQLAKYDLDFTQTTKLDRAWQQYRQEAGASNLPELKLALMGSSTLHHLVPGIRVGALRRGLEVLVHEGDYGTYYQDLMNPPPSLTEFKPDAVLLALDAHRAVAQRGSVQEQAAHLVHCWRLIQEKLGAAVIQQTILPVFDPLLGNNEHLYPDSPAQFVRGLNEALRSASEAARAHLLSVDQWAMVEGLRTWFDPSYWHRSKQEIHPRVAPLYGDQAARLLAAMRGLSAKCLVLDLDNTLWGGVVGDDGMEGIVLGQGHALGEAFLAFQSYVRSLSRRGVILAVCSKNTEAVARPVFEEHPEMVLKKEDIACFVCNWQDKASNLRFIAKTLNIGLDSLVFADDNPFERNLIRQELPMVATPELPEDPALYAQTLASAGYFEALTVVKEDQQRTALYAQNAERQKLLEESTDLGAYLRGLEMKLLWSPFDRVGLQRITQLINKSNQFNLTTRRYLAEEVEALLGDPNVMALQLRLVDKLGDNGMIAVIIGRIVGERLELDTWLMSCRVLARQVEEETLNLIVERARALGLKSLSGFYLPTAKNGMVKDHYQRLGFTLNSLAEDGGSIWNLDLASYVERETYIERIERGAEIAEGYSESGRGLRSSDESLSGRL